MLNIIHILIKFNIINIIYSSPIPVQVIAEVQGSLLGSKAIKDLSAKRLLIPSTRMWPKKKPHPPQKTVR